MNCVKQKTLWVDGHGFMEVPCGKCIACLCNRRNDWSIRLWFEQRHSTSSHFVTLTYDQKHMPSDHSLDKKHLQDYFKRLRKIDGTNLIRYYAVGEYGSKSGRPHYHVILFNGREEDARAAWRDSRGKPIGIVHVGAVTEASIRYTLKYLVQPEIVPDHVQKPFSLMSRKYGLGGMYLSQEMVDWHRDGDKNYIMHYGAKLRLPRFYREKIWPSYKHQGDRFTRWTSEYYNGMRKRVSEKGKALVLAKQEEEDRYYKETYGADWLKVKTEFRNAVLDRVSVKVAFTQTL